MATNPKVVAVDETEGAVRGRTRSPAYPFINLETAIKRAQEFYNHQLRNTASRVVAVKHWGYQEKSSGGLQTIAALIAYGLMQDEGTGEKRKLKLTPNAIRLILDKRPDSTERAQLIKEMALTPKIHGDLWDKWGGSLPEEQVRYTLTAEWEPPFNEKTVDGFIKEYKDTIAFAKLSESDKVGSEDGNNGKSEDRGYVPKVGDYVQWESNGLLRMKEAAKLVRFSTNDTFAFVEGSATGIPIGQVIRAEAPEAAPAALRSQITRPPVLPTTNMQEDVYSIPEGRLVVQWPASLSLESIEEIKGYLKLLEVKINRSLKKEQGESE